MLHCVTFSHKWKQKCFFLLVFFVHLPIKCLELVLFCVSWHFNDASMIYLPKSAIRIMLCLILHCYIQQWWRRLLFWFLSHHPCQSDVGQRDLRHGCLSRDMVSFLSLENALCLLSSKSGKKRIIAYFKPFTAPFSLKTISLFEGSNCQQLQWDLFFSNSPLSSFLLDSCTSWNLRLTIACQNHILSLIFLFFFCHLCVKTQLGIFFKSLNVIKTQRQKLTFEIVFSP